MLGMCQCNLFSVMQDYCTWGICFISFRVSSWDAMAATKMASMLASYLKVRMPDQDMPLFLHIIFPLG